MLFLFYLFAILSLAIGTAAIYMALIQSFPVQWLYFHYFQQATYKSIIGKLHPHTLTIIPFQILSWGEVKNLNPIPQVVKVTGKDFREFQLPIPRLWRKIVASEATPGLAAN